MVDVVGAQSGRGVGDVRKGVASPTGLPLNPQRRQ